MCAYALPSPRGNGERWSQLTAPQRNGAEVLGFTRKAWDESKLPAADEKPWSSLSYKKREGAKSLGYTERMWDGELGERPVADNVDSIVASADRIMADIDNH